MGDDIRERKFGSLCFAPMNSFDIDTMLKNSRALKHVKDALKALMEDKKTVGEMESECPRSPELVATKKREREMPSESSAKYSWPELVGLTAEAALEQIEKDNGDIVAVVLRPGILLSENLRQYRVRIFVDEKGLVTQVPMVG